MGDRICNTWHFLARNVLKTTLQGSERVIRKEKIERSDDMMALDLGRLLEKDKTGTFVVLSRDIVEELCGRLVNDDV